MKPAVKKSGLVKIMVFGTFDIVHKGHEHFFMQARALSPNPFLIVSLARDVNVAKIKGKKPKNTEMKRQKQLELITFVDKVVLGGVRKYLPHILKENPAIIALGYDQTAYVNTLKEDLKRAGQKTKIVRLKPYKPHLYKTSLLKI